jgi:hypothetical protein
MRQRLAALALAAFALCGGAHASVTDYITNNSFEDVQIGSPYDSTNPLDVPGWTKVGPNGDALLWAKGYHDGGGNVSIAADGNQFVTLGCGYANNTCGMTSWSQTFALPAGSYTLQFALAVELYNSTQGLNVALTGGASASQNFSATGTVPINYWADWQGKSLAFGANGAPVILTFSANNLPYDLGIDNIHVLSAVPEPESYAMIMAGLGLLGFIARRRRGRHA